MKKIFFLFSLLFGVLILLVGFVSFSPTVQAQNIGSLKAVVSPNFSFTMDLQPGDTDPDVLELQKVLNADPATMVASTGLGSSGNEVTYFGAITKAAVIKFQNKYRDTVLTPAGLTVGTGFVGKYTRTKLNLLIGVINTSNSVGSPQSRGSLDSVSTYVAPANSTVAVSRLAMPICQFVELLININVILPSNANQARLVLGCSTTNIAVIPSYYYNNNTNNNRIPSVDVKINGLNGPIYIDRSTAVTISWTSANVTSCYSQESVKPLSGSEVIQVASSGIFAITCTGSYGMVTDSVSVNLTSINSNLSVYCQASPNNIDINNSINWTATATGGTGSYTYTWSGDVTGSGRTISKRYLDIGVKSSTVSVTSGSLRASASCMAMVNETTDILAATSTNNSTSTNSASVPTNSTVTSTSTTNSISVTPALETYELGEWLNLQTAKRIALQNNKPLIVYVGNTICDYSNLALKNVFYKTEWKNYAKANGIPQYFAYTDSDVSRTLYREYPVAVFPTVLIFRVREDANLTNDYLNSVEMSYTIQDPHTLGGRSQTGLISPNVELIGRVVLRQGVTANGIKVTLTPANFINILKSFVANNTILNTPSTSSVPSVTCSANPYAVSKGNNITWTATATGGTGSYAYSWSGTDNLSGTGTSVSKTYSTVGAKTATVKVTSGSVVSASCTASITETTEEAISQCNGLLSSVTTDETTDETAEETTSDNSDGGTSGWFGGVVTEAGQCEIEPEVYASYFAIKKCGSGDVSEVSGAQPGYLMGMATQGQSVLGNATQLGITCMDRTDIPIGTVTNMETSASSCSTADSGTTDDSDDDDSGTWDTVLDVVTVIVTGGLYGW